MKRPAAKAMLRLGIPEYHFPHEVIDLEIEDILT